MCNNYIDISKRFSALVLHFSWSLVHSVRYYKVVSHTIGSEDIRAGRSSEAKQVRCTASSGEVADDKQQIERNVECGVAMQCFLFC